MEQRRDEEKFGVAAFGNPLKQPINRQAGYGMGAPSAEATSPRRGSATGSSLAVNQPIAPPVVAPEKAATRSPVPGEEPYRGYLSVQSREKEPSRGMNSAGLPAKAAAAALASAAQPATAAPALQQPTAPTAAFTPGQAPRAMRDVPGASGESLKGAFGDFLPAGTFDKSYTDMGGGIAGKGSGSRGQFNDFTNISASGAPTAISGKDSRTPDQIANGNRITQETAGVVAAAGGLGNLQRQNAIMAANIRDGLDPRRGLDGGQQVSIMQNTSGSGGRGPEVPIQTGRGMREQQRINADIAQSQARLGMDKQRAGLDADRTANDLATGAQSREIRGMEIAAAKQLQALQAQYLAAGPEQKAQLAQTLRDLQGKEVRSPKDDLIAVGGGQEYDEKNGFMRNVAPRLYNAREGKFVDMPQGAANVAAEPINGALEEKTINGEKVVSRYDAKTKTWKPL